MMLKTIDKIESTTANLVDWIWPKSNAVQNRDCASRRLLPGDGRVREPRGYRISPFAIGILLAIVSCAFLIAQNPRALLTPVTREEVWQAVVGELRQRGVRDEQLLTLDEIELPAAVPATASRTLRVSIVCWDADLERAQFQLECRHPGECVPFLAYAEAARSTAMGSEKIAGSACRAASQRRATTSAPRKDLIRVGDRATVVFRGSQLNLTALVTCLERGAEGAIVRVRNQDGQVFRARVAAPARLEALTP